MSHRITAVLAIVLLLLSGCAAMSKKDCLNADWYSLGIQDGRAGYPSNKVSSYVQMCSKHDISINQNNYLQGHAEGIRFFCQPENGYQLGLKGRTLPQTCPAELQPAFSKAYDKGYIEFKIREDITHAHNDYDSAINHQNSTEAKLVDALALLYSKGNDQDKTSAQQGVDRLNSQIQEAITAQIRAVGLLACASGDWYKAGFTDGSAGRGGSTYAQHINQCQPYHPKSNQSSFIQGQSAGLQEYCTYDMGFSLGKKGRALSDLCQGRSASDLKAGYDEGIQSYNKEVAITGLRIRKSDLESSVWPLNSEKAQLESQLAHENLLRSERLSRTRQLNNILHKLTRLDLSLAETTDELNCYVADWQVLGFESGERGEMFKNRSMNCRKYGISVDTQAFKSGYDAGLTRFCTFENGQKQGNAGYEYINICPRSLEDDFLDGYLPAYKAYQQAQLKNQLRQDQEDSTKELNNLRAELDSLTLSLEQGGLPRQEKIEIINEISRLSAIEEQLSIEVQRMSSHQQCLTNDWLALGIEHGDKGLGSQLRQLGCERFDVSPDLGRYHRGLDQGLNNWCTENRGYEMAINSEAPTSACSRTAHAAYHRGYRNGQAELENREVIKDLKLEKLAILEKLPGWKQRIAEIDAALLSVEIPEHAKRRLRSDKLQLEKQLLNSDIRIEQIDKELIRLGAYPTLN